MTETPRIRCKTTGGGWLNWRNAYDGYQVIWIERIHDGLLYRGWRLSDGRWAGRVVGLEENPLAGWFRNGAGHGDWQCATLDEMEQSIQTAAVARRLLLEAVRHGSDHQ